MSKSFIKFRSGYKYQLASDFQIKITIKPKIDIDDKYIKIDKKGNMTIIAGYAWDGPSGPVPDTNENMRASLVHDALYQLMRHKYLKVRESRNKADKLFMKMCIEDGVPRRTAKFYYIGLKTFGKPNADPKKIKKIYKAPA